LDAMTAVTADAGTGTVVNGPKDAQDWHGADRDQADRDVRRLRQRIFAASQAGDLNKVRNFQGTAPLASSRALRDLLEPRCGESPQARF
jgi:hypothetical protein